MRLYCRNCTCFVRSIIATCGHCGYEHTRDSRATEEPIRKRNPSRRMIPVRKVRR